MSRFSMTATPTVKTPKMDRGRSTFGIPGTIDRNQPRTSFAAPPTSARRSSFFKSMTAASFKDPRLITAPQFKHAMIVKIHEFLQGELPMESVKLPSRKDFVFMFEYIYQTFGDTNFALPKNIDEANNTVIYILKHMGYPITIKPSSLKTVNVQSSWQPLLAALGWMVDVATCFNQLESLETLYMTNDETDGYKRAMKYALDASLCKKDFEAQRAGLSEQQVEELLEREMKKCVDTYRANVASRYDLDAEYESLMESKKRLEEELAYLNADKESDQRPALTREIKNMEDDVVELANFVEQCETLETKLENDLDQLQFQLDEDDSKITSLKASIESKKKRIAQQTAESGMDKAAMKALVHEKAAITLQLTMLNTELETLSRQKYSLAPKGSDALLAEQNKYRKLLTSVYDMRHIYLGHQDKPLLDSIPSDIRAVIDAINGGVRQLVRKTKEELIAKRTETGASIRRLVEEVRVLEAEEGRIRLQLNEETDALDRESRQRQNERDEWARETSVREREKKALEQEMETLKNTHKQLGSLSQQLKEAELDLREAQTLHKENIIKFDEAYMKKLMEVCEGATLLTARQDAIREKVAKLEAQRRLFQQNS